jgi:hypothetical protein
LWTVSTPSPRPPLTQAVSQQMIVFENVKVVNDVN